MKLRFDVAGRTQPDPFIFADSGKLYLYVTAGPGVEAYTADALDGVWRYAGVVCSFPGARDFWAPCVIRTGGRYFMYFSCESPESHQYLHVAEAAAPLGPFTGVRRLFDRFTIDAHVVKTRAGLFLFYAEDNPAPARPGTRIFVDRLLDPRTPQGLRREILQPTFDEEIYQRDRFGDGRDWHTLEGPFWFAADGWQYLMYSGGCYGNDSYHVGYAVARDDEADLTRVSFVKHTADGAFDPLLVRNGAEEGTGHHSVLARGGECFIIYHARDLDAVPGTEARTARYARLRADAGTLAVERR